MTRTRGPSVKKELLFKSREAALNAVQTFNNPLTTFKPESTERRLWRQSLKKPEGAPLNLG